MLKSKFKVLLSIFLVLILISSITFATTVNDIMPISEDLTENDISEDLNNVDTTDSSASWVNNDLYVAESNPVIDDIVDGNAFVMGNTVTITGEIGGDLFVVANKLIIDGGYVYSSIFAIANEIEVNGVVYDIYAISNKFELGTNGFVYRDLKVSASTVTINGKVRRDAYITADKFNFAEDNGSLIYGDLKYTANEELELAEDIVAGEMEFTKAQQITNAASISDYIYSLIRLLLLNLVIALLVVFLAPMFKERVTNMSVAKSFVSLGIGFATPLVFIFVSVILILSVIGSQLFALLTFILFLLFMIGFSITSIYCAGIFEKVLKSNNSKVKFILFTLLSAIILWILCQIPYIGWICSLLISLFGVGTTLVNIVYKKESKKEEIEQPTVAE